MENPNSIKIPYRYKREYITYIKFGNPTRRALARTKLLDLPVYTKCIVKTPRGTELAETLPRPSNLPQPVEETNIRIKVLRRANQVDINYFNAIKKDLEPRELEFLKNKSAELKLDMEPILVEHLLGNEKIIFYFYSKEKIDFRELLKILAKEFKTHIELRQLNKVERTCILSEVGYCGKPLCCKNIFTDYCDIYKKLVALELSEFTEPKEPGQGTKKGICCLLHNCFLEAQKVDKEAQS